MALSDNPRNNNPDFDMRGLAERVAQTTSNLPFGKLLPVLIPLALLLWFLMTCYYTVDSSSVAVVQRFGAYYATEESGLHWKLPFGIDTITDVPVKRQLKMEFGFQSSREGVNPAQVTNPNQLSPDPEGEKQMVTGDLNAANVEWIVQYKISDPRDYLFHVREPGPTLRAATEAVLREVVGDRTVDDVITVGRSQIESKTKEILQNLLTSYQIGITVDNVQMYGINPPIEVRASFNEVNQAQQDREKSVNVANGKYNEVIPQAEGEAKRKIQEAEGYAFKRINEAQGDVARFNALFAEYIKAPEITRQRYFLETMTKVLPLVGKKIILDETTKGVLPLLQLSDPHEQLIPPVKSSGR